MKVRLAKVSDLSDIVAYAKLAHESTNYRVLPFNSVVARRSAKAAMTDANMRVWVAEDEGRICGLLVGQIGELPSTHYMGATDLVFYADKGGELLLDAFIEWCKLRRVVARLDMGISSGPEREKAVRRFFRSRGFEYSGQMFHLVLPVGDAP